jgi:4-amino-4-deoxy-L-arabinose transferase-like glycosyltransferase
MSARASAPAWAVLIILVSLLPKAYYSAQMPFDADFVPLIWWGWEWLNGGAFPAYGTLSSVGAYNFPMLVWLHLPALSLTYEAQSAVLATLLWLNVVGMACFYSTARHMFGAGAATCALLLFAFSETLITSAYTAWAQVLLPSGFACLTWVLWRWVRSGRARWLALSGVLATCLFMLHFSAILLYPCMLAFALFQRARWSWRGIIAGGLVCLALFAPYLGFQVGRDFRDLRAFLTRQTPIPAETMRAYQELAYPSAPSAPADATPAPLSPSAPPESPTLLTRAIREGETVLSALTAFAPPNLPYAGVAFLACVAFALGLGLRRARPDVRPAWSLLLMVAVFVLGLAVARIYPSAQPTYLMGLLAWGALLCGWGVWACLGAWRWGRVLAVLACVVVAFGTQAQRLAREPARQEALFPQAWYFSQVASVTDAIAEAFGRDTTLTIAYDLLPEMRFQWWAMAWHTVDARYHLGMAYDFLLLSRHNIRNRNISATGTADTPDALIVLDEGLARHSDALTNGGRALRIGRVVVLVWK